MSYRKYMTYREYKKEYDALWSQAEHQPMNKAMKTLKKCAELKKRYFNGLRGKR